MVNISKKLAVKKAENADWLPYQIEEWDGQPVFKIGYKSVLNKTKTIEEIMACSTFQSYIITYLFKLLNKFFDDDDKYFVASNEIGVHAAFKNNYGIDLAVFDWKVLTPDKISKKFADVPPFLAVEVDVDVAVGKGEVADSVDDFVSKKTKRLHDFGVEKIIWVFPTTKNVLISEKNKAWQIFDWSENIEWWPGQTFNVGAYLKKKGLLVD